jgi:hypothetical protein
VRVEVLFVPGCPNYEPALEVVQLYRGRNPCRKRSTMSVTLFWFAVAIVLLIVLFPQVIATLFAA